MFITYSPSVIERGAVPKVRRDRLLEPARFAAIVCFGRVYTKSGHIWPKPMVLGPEPWVWARCGHFWWWRRGDCKMEGLRLGGL